MEKLNKVLSGLEHCRDKDRGCEGCPYFECDDCENRLYQDTVERLEWTTVLKGTKLYMAREYRKLEEKLAAVEAERDDLRKDIEVLNAINGDLSAAVERVAKKLQIARAERDLAREKLARITGERESAWVELGGETDAE